MSKGLFNMSKDERKATISRRLMISAGGLGTIAAKEAQDRETEKARQEAIKLSK